MTERIISRLVYIYILVFSSNAFAQQQYNLPSQLFNNTDTNKMSHWVDSVFNTMTLKEKAGQFIMPIVWIDGNKNTLEKTKKALKDGLWGGILFQKTNINDQIEATNILQKASRIPLLISLDGEWGLYMRIKDAPRFPRNMGLGYSADTTLIYKYAKEVARQCKLMGIHIDFAPDIDVNINPKNPVIGTRSFGENPQIVSTLSNSFSKGLEDNDIMSVAKHFPGHGDTYQDSHKTLPTISVSKARLDSVELIPFISYIEKGFSGIMVGHLNVPSLDSSNTPTSLSYKVVTNLLKDSLSFNGLIFTDALEMKGAVSSKKGSIGLQALKAGNDILLGATNPTKLVEEIVEAINNKEIDINDIDNRVKKILAYKYRLIIQPNNRYPKTDAKSKIWNKQLKELQDSIWDSSISIIENKDNYLSKLDNKNTINIIIGKPLSQKATGIYKSNKYPINSIVWQQAKSKQTLAQIKKYNKVIIHINDIRKITDYSLSSIVKNTPSAIIWYHSPYTLSKSKEYYKKAKAIVVAYENCEEAQSAVARIIIKSINESHKIKPKEVKTISKSNMKDVIALAQKGVEDGAYPGCQVYFSVKGNTMLEKSFGTKSGKKKDSLDIVTNNTIYDLASLTKALATTPAVMLLVSQKKINLNAKIIKYLPEFRTTQVGNITIQDLLFHQSGLPAGLPFYEDLIDSISYSSPLTSNRYINGYVSIWKNAWGNPNFNFNHNYISTEKIDDTYSLFSPNLFISNSFKNVMLNRLSKTKIRRAGRYKYSDLNFVLLQQIIERVSGQPLDKFVEENIYKPLGVGLKFKPLDKGIQLDNIAPSQVDNFIRKAELRGTVDDETAACLGGVSGSAGLFGSVDDVAKVCHMYLNNGKSIDGKTIIPYNTLQKFTKLQSRGALRFLGFDKPSKKRNTVTAQAASYSTFGHLGFTGTCFWVDPIHKTIFVFLSNRTYPNRNNTKLIKDNYRTELQELCYNAIGLK